MHAAMEVRLDELVMSSEDEEITDNDESLFGDAEE